MPSSALVLTGITKRVAKGPEHHGISWRLKQFAHVAGLGPKAQADTAEGAAEERLGAARRRCSRSSQA